MLILPKKILLIVGICGYASIMFGQQKASDSTTTLQNYTPSILLKQGGFEAKLFNNLYTQTHYFSETTKVFLNSRATYYTSFVQFLYGNSKNRRINLGADIIFKGVQIDEPASSPFGILAFRSSDASRYGISAIGPKIKFVPVKKIQGFSVQSAFWIPLIKDSEVSYPWLDYHRYTWWTQFFLDRSISDQFRLFAETDFYFLLGKRLETDKFELRTPASVILSYFPSKKITVYVLHQFAPTVSNWRYYYQPGIGTKYLFTSNFELELLYTRFVAGRESGAGETFNLGIRVLQ